jgi:hypothetical protein
MSSTGNAVVHEQGDHDLPGFGLAVGDGLPHAPEGAVMAPDPVHHRASVAAGVAQDPFGTGVPYMIRGGRGQSFGGVEGLQMPGGGKDPDALLDRDPPLIRDDSDPSRDPELPAVIVPQGRSQVELRVLLRIDADLVELEYDFLLHRREIGGGSGPVGPVRSGVEEGGEIPCALAGEQGQGGD